MEKNLVLIAVQNPDGTINSSLWEIFSRIEVLNVVSRLYQGTRPENDFNLKSNKKLLLDMKYCPAVSMSQLGSDDFDDKEEFKSELIANISRINNQVFMVLYADGNLWYKYIKPPQFEINNFRKMTCKPTWDFLYE